MDVKYLMGILNIIAFVLGFLTAHVLILIFDLEGGFIC